jgi:hypothetical protein
MPEIAELAGAARKKAIAALETDNPAIFAEYKQDKRHFEAANGFARDSKRFELTARGKINTYSLFAELFANLASQRGRAGVIVPTGIATDATTAQFFAALVGNQQLIRLISFENEGFIFPNVHHSFRFSLITCSNIPAEPRPRFAFFLRGVEQLANPNRHFSLSAEEIARINPNTKTAPIFRARADAELTAKIYTRVPVLIDEATGSVGNPWGIEFRQGLFNMTSDSALFRTAAQLDAGGFVRDNCDWIGEARYVPLYEAKMIHQFDHRWATYDGADSRDSTLLEKHAADFEPLSRYWVPETEVRDRLAAKGWTRGWLMGWREITSAHVLRTVIAAVFPRLGVSHKLPIFFVDKSPRLTACILGNLSSFLIILRAKRSVGHH